jgi:BRCA1-associated ATM activator 1
VLGGESEGVVRREAVACIVAVYNHQQIPPLCLDIIFSVMAHCAVKDFYWEVKVNALSFWCTVISRQFTHQGMIDGTFPAVTFSKEHRKIITLTNKVGVAPVSLPKLTKPTRFQEIQLRLLKVLNELSLRGCLGILVACLKENDLEVVKTALDIVEKMMKRMDKYNFVEEYFKSKKGSTLSSPTKPVFDSNFSEFEGNLASAKDPGVRNNADFSRTTEVSMGTSRDNGEPCICPNNTVIESIMESDDYSLLAKTCKANLNIQEDCKNCELGQIKEDLFKQYATVTPDDFLALITTTDLKALLNEKSEWLHHSEDFSSLLDDVLRSFDGNMECPDCY